MGREAGTKIGLVFSKEDDGGTGKRGWTKLLCLLTKPLAQIGEDGSERQRPHGKWLYPKRPGTIKKAPCR